MNKNKALRMLALLLVLVLFCSAGAAGAQTYGLELSGNGEKVAAKIGLDSDSLPGLWLLAGEDAVTIDRKGFRLDSGDESMGISYEALLKAFLMEVLGTNELPAFAQEDASLVLALLAQLWEDASARAAVVQQEETGSGTKTTLTIRAKAFLEDLDQAVQKLLGEKAAKVDGLLAKYAQITQAVFGSSAGSLRSAELLEAWKSLNVSGLMVVELPLTAAVESKNNGSWQAEISFIGMGAELAWDGAALTGELSLGGETYTFNTRDFAWLFSLFENLPEKIPAEAFQVLDYWSSGTRCLDVRINGNLLINSAMRGLGEQMHSQPLQARAFVERYAAWLDLFGVDVDGLTYETLVQSLCNFGTFSVAGYHSPLYLLLGETSVSFRRPAYGSALPLSLEVFAAGYDFSLALNEKSISAELNMKGYERWTLSGWVDGMTGEAVLSNARGYYHNEVFRLTLKPEGTGARAELRDGEGKILLSGIFSGSSFVFEAAGGAYGSLHVNRDEAQFNLYDGYSFSNVAARVIGSEVQLDANVFNQNLRLRVSPARFEFSGPFSISLQEIFGDWHAAFEYGGIFASLEVTGNGLHFKAWESYRHAGMFELHLSENTLSLFLIERVNWHRLLLSRVDPAVGADFALHISYDGWQRDEQTAYEGLLTAFEEADGLRLVLTSDAHTPVTCRLTAVQAPFSSPAPQGCHWLSAAEIRQLIYGSDDTE